MTAWIDVCALEDLVPERGAAALLEGTQIAVFRLLDDEVVAVQQKDPFSGANVLSRGLVGSAGDRTIVSSPMYKQVWDVRTGECLDAAGKTPQDLASYPARVADGRVEVQAVARVVEPVAEPGADDEVGR
ncbi:ferredoxin [Flavimobilis marinus]|uniref:Assimilatory nitrite reductase (NAD(P)H) small subunit n=1 Tax=Flavimobilis marinus TaxID=285351 RepID=A0A1I2I1Q8_9MICO|nr:nitrite reductase small subunit NirD [Flavimobilis marinus]GHG48579.1 ferredoxin [Flavimobilis marinus]SFF36132.1 assimilatory nitrite reductase (NAD(P)H) small subunit [Flavimobilis marinus]